MTELVQLDRLNKLHNTFHRFGPPLVSEGDDGSTGTRTRGSSIRGVESTNIPPISQEFKLSNLSRKSALSLSATVKPKAKTEFISLSSDMEKKLLASRGAKAKQKKRHELLVKHIKATRADEIRQKAFR